MGLAELGVAEVEGFEFGDDDVGDGGAGEPLVVGGDDVPGRPFGAGVVEGVLEGVHVVVPEGALFGVVDGELPVLLGRVDAREEALLLLLLRDVEEEFEDVDAVADEVVLEVVDLLEAVPPDFLLVLRLGGELLVAEDFGVDADDQDLLVVGAVEDADAPALGQRLEAAPEVVVVELFV